MAIYPPTSGHLSNDAVQRKLTRILGACAPQARPRGRPRRTPDLDAQARSTLMGLMDAAIAHGPRESVTLAMAMLEQKDDPWTQLACLLLGRCRQQYLPRPRHARPHRHHAPENRGDGVGRTGPTAQSA